jgi:hypothetical protein
MLHLMTDEECLAAEALFGFCWWCGARDDLSPEDPAYPIYQAFLSGSAADDPRALVPEATHEMFGSSATLAIEVLRHDKSRLLQHVSSVDEEWTRWRPGADVDVHLPAFITRATDADDADSRLAAARGLLFEAFHFGARTAAMSGGKHNSGLALVIETADRMASSCRETGLPVSADELKTIVRDAASSAPGAYGVFVVIPFVDQSGRDDLVGARESADQMVAYLARETPTPLIAHVLDDRQLVAQVAQRLSLGTAVATNGVFVTIALANPDDPNDTPGVLRNANRLVHHFGTQDVPARILDAPDLVASVAGHLTS